MEGEYVGRMNACPTTARAGVSSAVKLSFCVAVLSVLCACTDPYTYPPPYQRTQPFGGGAGTTGGGGGFGGGHTDGGGAGNCGAGFEGEVPSKPVTEPPPLIGGTMVALKAGGFVIGDADRSLVWLVSADLAAARQVALSAGDEPGRAVEGADGHAYVVLRRADQLADVDFVLGTVRRIPTCHLPRGLAARGTTLVVACLGGELETLEPTTGQRTPIATSAPLSDLRDVVVDGSRLLVTQLRSGSISSIAADGTVKEFGTTAVEGFAPHVAWRAVPRTGGGAVVVRQQHRTRQLPTGGCDAYGGGGLSGTGGAGGNNSSVVQVEAVTVAGELTSRTALTDGFLPMALPVDLAVSPTGRVAVLSAGSGTLMLLSLGATSQVALVDHGVDTQVTSVVFSGESAFVFVREPARLVEVDPQGNTAKSLSLGGVSVASTGHELFHRATVAGVACASCHPEAGEDGHIWQFTEGARRTPTLRGGLGGTAPFHWSGDQSSMSALMNDVMVLRMSGPGQTDARMNAVESWLTAQPAIAAPVLDAAAVARGRTVFESSATACTSCHAGPQGTNNATVSVGTGAAFQVPRLAEFAWRAPWFHDGRMATLQARFDATSGGDAHGRVGQLTVSERTDLMEYLRSR